MPLPRFAAKRDANEAEIIEALVATGASVVQLSVKGVPDLLVGYQSVTHGAGRNQNCQRQIDTRPGTVFTGLARE